MHALIVDTSLLAEQLDWLSQFRDDGQTLLSDGLENMLSEILHRLMADQIAHLVPGS